MTTKKKTWHIALLVILIIPISLAIYFIKDAWEEQIIAQEFPRDVKQFSNVHVNNFMLWEGDSRVDITIKNKGEVSFWYGADRVPRIEAIGRYGTTYECFYVDNQGKKLENAYTTDLELDTDTYAKWFPFKIHSIKDLLAHYDDIIAVLKTFPKDPQLNDFSDEQVLKKTHTNPNFITKTRFQMKPVVCDLYQ